MPVAAHIVAVTPHAASGAGARGKAVSADSKVDSKTSPSGPGGASDQDFGALFREQAGMVAPAKPDVAAGLKDETPPEEANPAVVKANGKALGFVGKNVVAPEPMDAAAADLPQALTAPQLKKDLSYPAQSDPEIVAAHASAAAASDANFGGKKGIESSSAKAEVGTKAEASGKKEKCETSSATATASLPVAAIAAAPVVSALTVPVKTAVAAAKDTPKPLPAAALNAIPAQGAAASLQPVPSPAEHHSVPASGPAAASGAAVQEPNTKSAGMQPVTDLTANDSAAPSKAPADTVKTLASAASAQRSSTIHPPANEVAAPVAAVHAANGSDVPNSAPRMSQQVPTAASAAANVPSAAPAVAGNAYDRIDQGMAPVVLHSGAQHVSVGVQDPNLGWVEIKTQNIGGHVDATLVTTSGQSHDTLATQLPAMAQFLEQRDVRVGALAVHHEAPSGQSSFIGNGSGNGANYGSGTGYSGQPGSGQGSGQGPGESRSTYAGISSRASRIATVPVGVGANDDAVLRPVSYISVRA